MHDAFWGSVSQSAVGPATFTRVDSCAQRVFRTPSRIARASEDFVLVALGNSGVNGVYQDGREAVVSAGQFTILRYHPSLRAALRRQLFADHPSDASKTSATAHRRVDKLTATTFSSDRPLESLVYEFLVA